MKDQELLEQISKKLNTLIALSFVKETEKMTIAAGVELLARFGLSDQDIATILGTTKGTVQVLKSRITKAKKQQYAKTTEES